MSCLINMYQEFIFKFKVTVRLTSYQECFHPRSIFPVIAKSSCHDTAIFFILKVKWQKLCDWSNNNHSCYFIGFRVGISVGFLQKEPVWIQRWSPTMHYWYVLMGIIDFKDWNRKYLLLKCILVFPFNIPWNNLYLNILNSTTL